MKIKITNKEETGRVRYVSYDVEVDNDKKYSLEVTLIENYDSNSDSYDSEYEVIWPDREFVPENWEEVEKNIIEHIKKEGQ
jgi:hypothetical protein